MRTIKGTVYAVVCSSQQGGGGGGGGGRLLHAFCLAPPLMVFHFISSASFVGWVNIVNRMPALLTMLQNAVKKLLWV